MNLKKKNNIQKLEEKENNFEFIDQISQTLFDEINPDEDIKEKLRENQKIVDGHIFFIYIRISKEGEYDMSLIDQLKTLLTNANKNGHKIIIKGEKKSGSKDGRKEFDDMIKTILKDSQKEKRLRDYGGIYVFKLDRFARNSIDFTRGEKLLNAGYRIISATETIENTPTGRLLFRMLSSFAIYESEKLSNRQTLTEIQNLVRLNLRALGGKLDIFGYRFTNIGNKKLRSEDKILEVVPEQKSIVLRIYSIYEDISDEKSENYIKEDLHKWKYIWEKLATEERNIIIKSKIPDKVAKDENKTQSQKNYNAIRNIIENKQKLKYNGQFERDININDELIINYINNNNKEGSEYELKGDNEVGSTITFKFIFPDLAIIGDKTYENTRKEIRKKESGKIVVGKYSDILKYIHSDGYISSFKAYPSSKIPTALQYRFGRTTDYEKIEISYSEGNITKALLKDKRFLNVKFNDEQLEFFRKESLKYIGKHINLEKDKLKGRKLAYNRIINDLDYEIENVDYSSYDLELKNKNKQLYRKLLKEVELEEDRIEEFINESFEIYMGIYKDIKEIILEKDPEFANAKLKVLISSIYLDEEKNIKHIEYNSFIKKILGMKD
ncbi:MAG: recombinase family protein [Candidatus Gracilibacteria bacterium]|nr:recombinase family protein [Candidatus Gracilibacteria bacterium]